MDGSTPPLGVFVYGKMVMVQLNELGRNSGRGGSPLRLKFASSPPKEFYITITGGGGELVYLMYIPNFRKTPALECQKYNENAYICFICLL